MVGDDHLVNVVNHHDAPSPFDRDSLPRILLVIDVPEGYLVALPYHCVKGYQRCYRSPVPITTEAFTLLPGFHILIYILFHQELAAPSYQVALYWFGLLLNVRSVLKHECVTSRLLHLLLLVRLLHALVTYLLLVLFGRSCLIWNLYLQLLNLQLYWLPTEFSFVQLIQEVDHGLDQLLHPSS